MCFLPLHQEENGFLICITNLTQPTVLIYPIQLCNALSHHLLPSQSRLAYIVVSHRQFSCSFQQCYGAGEMVW